MDFFYLWIDYRYRNIIRNNKIIFIIILISILLAAYIYSNYENFYDSSRNSLNNSLYNYDNYDNRDDFDRIYYSNGNIASQLIDPNDDQNFNITSTPSERVPYDPILGSTADPTANLYRQHQLPHITEVALFE
jgi:hypothetical protein